MKVKDFVVISIALIMITVSFTVLGYNLVVVDEVKEIDIILKVDNVVGLNTENDAIKFGRIPPGGIGERKFTLYNDHNQDMRALIYVEGDVADYVKISEKNFWLKPKESKNVSVNVFVPENAEIKEYSGKMRVLLRTR